MPDPIGITSGLLTLAAFAFQSSKMLYAVVASFQSNQRNMRELKEELESLDGVLQSLQETVTSTEVDLSALKLPLLRCGHACKGFEALIVRCTGHSEGPRTSFRDWAKFQYMGDDIKGFKNMLAGYKSTINIALAGANLRTSTITLDVLEKYKQMIADTTSDLEEHIQRMDSKLQAIYSQGAIISDEDAAERQQIEEERDSTQQCLDICAKVYAHIDQVQPTPVANISTPLATYQEPVTTQSGFTPAEVVTAETLNVCKENIAQATTTLKRNLQAMNNRLQAFSQSFGAPGEMAAEKKIMQEEIESIKQCLAICSQASTQADQGRINVFEDISMADDGNQVIVSTIGELISAKRVSAGARSMQLIGQMSDETLRQLSLGRAHTATETAMAHTGEGTQFVDRYGPGTKLTSPR